jgi:hypothetical protein
MLWLLLRGDWKRAFLALIGAGICAFFSDADDLASFKLSATGFETHAKTVVAEAELATNDIRKVAVAAAEATVSIDGRANFGVDGTLMPPAAVRDERKKQILSVLRSLKVSNDDIGLVEAADRQGVMETYETAIWQRADKLVKTPTEILNMSSGRVDPEKVDAFMKSNNFKDQVLADLNEDYREYIKTGKQRRPDFWAARDTWFRKGR